MAGGTARIAALLTGVADRLHGWWRRVRFEIYDAERRLLAVYPPD